MEFENIHRTRLQLATYKQKDYDSYITWQTSGHETAYMKTMNPYALMAHKRRYHPFLIIDKQAAEKYAIALPKVPNSRYLIHTEGDVTRFVVTEESAPQLFKDLYLNLVTAYKSRDKLYYYVKSHYLGISKTDCMKFIKNTECNQIHAPQRIAKVHNPIITREKRERFQIDGIEVVINESTEQKKNKLAALNEGYRYCYNVIDCFTKRAWVIPTKTKEQKEWVGHLKKIFEDYGAPKVLQGDNEFRDSAQSLYGKLCKKYKVEIKNSNAFSPNTNGAIERFNKTLKEKIAFTFTTYNTKGWKEGLSDIVANYNNSQHSTTGFTPNELEAAEPGSEKVKTAGARIITKAHKMAKGKPKLPPLSVGDTVRVSHKPEIDKFKNKILKYKFSIELYEVISQERNFGEPAFKLKNIETGESLGRLYYRSELLKIDPDKLDTENYELDSKELGESKEKVYEVEKLLKKRTRAGKVEYLVQWVGYPGEDSWESASSIHTASLIKEFNLSNKKQTRRSK